MIFLPRLTILDCYLKSRPRLAWVHCQSFDNLSRKACYKIWLLLFRMEGTIMIVESKATCWMLGMSPTVARGHNTATVSRGLATRCHHGQRCCFMVNGAGSTHFGLFWSISTRAYVKKSARVGRSCRRSWVRREEEREKHGREGEKKKTREKESRQERRRAGRSLGRRCTVKHSEKTQEREGRRERKEKGRWL